MTRDQAHYLGRLARRQSTIRAGLIIYSFNKRDGRNNAHSHRGQTPKRETAAEVIQDVARKRGAEGSADADCAADDAEPKVEPSGAAHDVRNNKRENDPENGGADAIEELHGASQKALYTPR